MIGVQQRQFEWQLLAFDTGPMHQAVRIEGVVDVRTRAEGKADACPTLADHRLRFGDLRRRASIFFAEMIDNGLAFRAHLRIQLEGMDHYLGVDRFAKIR